MSGGTTQVLLRAKHFTHDMGKNWHYLGSEFDFSARLQKTVFLIVNLPNGFTINTLCL